MNTPEKSKSALHVIKPTHRAVKKYYEMLQAYGDQQVDHEGAVSLAFQRLLEDTGKTFGWTFLGKLGETVVEGRIIPDGTLRDNFRLERGYWEAKDTHDDLDLEIRKKLAKGYPLSNIIFEDTRQAVLIQNGREILRVNLTEPQKLTDLNCLPIFVVAYLHKDLNGSNHGLFVSAIQQEQEPFEVYEARPITYNPDNVIPALTRDGDDHFACATKADASNISHRLAALWFDCPGLSDEWYDPIDWDVSVATHVPNNPPARFYEVSIADSNSSDGVVNIVFTDYNSTSSQREILNSTIDFTGNSANTYRLDENAATTDLDPAIAVSAYPRKLILWDGSIDDGNRLIARFDPWHFDSQSLASDGPPQIISQVANPIEGYLLSNGYPNPFNASIILGFKLPQASPVTLKIYDVQGRLVAILINGWRAAGNHQVTFDGSKLSSGIYFYTMKAGEFTATKKVLLLK